MMLFSGSFHTVLVGLILKSTTLQVTWHDTHSTLRFKKTSPPFFQQQSNNSVDRKWTWTIYCRNTARGIHNLLLCTFTYYLIMQLGTSLACVAMVTDLKKRRAQELTAANCIAPDLCVTFYAGCWLHFLHRWKNVHCNSTSQQSKWLRVCSRDYMMWRRCQPTLTYPPDFQ